MEVDEVHIGGSEQNRHAKEPPGPPKALVAGVKDRTTNEVNATVIPSDDRLTPHTFIRNRVKPGATVYTDGHPSYQKLHGYEHEAVKHTVGEYVRAKVHTNGIESAWSMLKRGYKGTYHRMSWRNPNRSVNVFTGGHNHRELDTLDQMTAVGLGMNGKRLKYEELTGRAA